MHNDLLTPLQALGSMLAAKKEALPQDMLPEVAARLLDALATHCSSGALPVDRPCSRYVYTLLRTLQAAVRQVCIWLACPTTEATDATMTVNCHRLHPLHIYCNSLSSCIVKEHSDLWPPACRWTACRRCRWTLSWTA